MIWLYPLAIALSTAILHWRHQGGSILRHFYMVLAVAAAAYWGGDVFNSVLTGEPLGSGRVFYGALIGAVLASAAVTYQFPRALRVDYWHTGAIICAFDYGLLRIGCFLDGCCWGQMTDLPWAVVYTSADSLMPYKGVPVHPAQLYDSIFGFLLAGFLLWYRTRARGNAILTFFALYSIGRFVTEMFRGDAIRGVNLALGLSTSQVISIALLFGAGVYFLVHRYFGSRESLSTLAHR